MTRMVTSLRVPIPSAEGSRSATRRPAGCDPPIGPLDGGGQALGTDARRALLRRAAILAAGIAAFAVVAHAAGGPARTFAAALERAAGADPGWVAAAVSFEVLSFAGYVALLWHVAGRATSRIGLRASYEITLAGAAATRLLPTAGAGGAALTLWALRRAGHRDRAGVRTLLTFLVLLYAVFLLAVLAAGTLVATGVVHAAGPAALSAAPAAGALLAMAVALACMLRARRASGSAAVLRDAMRDAARLLRRADPRLLGAPAWWAFDLAVLYATFSAVGTPPPLAVLVLGYFVGQVANTIPVPGAASGGMVGVLLAFGVPAEIALPSVLAYRAIAIWTPAPFGAVALASLRRRAAGWVLEDGTAGDTAVAAPAVPAPTAPAGTSLPRRLGRGRALRRPSHDRTGSPLGGLVVVGDAHGFGRVTAAI
jgi:uncharacterized membrane protein YbhN (UPF0104 family)